MPETSDAKEKLQQALARLDEVVATRSSQQASLQEEAKASDKTLQVQIDALQQENAGLKAELVEARAAYVALEEVADAVDSRLNTAIGSIRTVMAH
jgi:chromosome segregation ATPase